MTKFAKLDPKRPEVRGPVKTTVRTRTYNGGAGFALGEKASLYTLAVTDMVGEPTYYEAGSARTKRLVDLVHTVTAKDAPWVAAFASWLRTEANMRSAPIVVAVEYMRAGGPHARSVINSVCQRADEPAEILGYYMACYGRKLPMALKRGVADAARRLYNERALLKWDSSRSGIRFGDVIDLTHPHPTAEWQSVLFKHAIDKRHGRVMVWDDVERLPILHNAYKMEEIAPAKRRAYMREHPELIKLDWERLSGWVPGGMDAEAWEAAIPNMGYMALLRNLRNFEEKGVSKAVLRQVAEKIADPDEVARSRQFPFRFWSAYKNSGTMFFGPALEEAMELSMSNVPTFKGRTLVMVDSSGSMENVISAKSSVTRTEVAAVVAGGIKATSDIDMAIFGTYVAMVENLPHSTLRTIEALNSVRGTVGHSTNTWPCTEAVFNPDRHDRIVVITDEQANPSRGDYFVPKHVPVYVIDTAGYGKSSIALGDRRALIGGFNDASFNVLALLERGLDAGWPWEN